MNREINSGWFIRFSPEEKEDEEALLEFLNANDYEPDGSGIKEFLLDSIYTEKKKKSSKIAEVIQENPELIAESLGFLGNYVKAAFNKKIFKK